MLIGEPFGTAERPSSAAGPALVRLLLLFATSLDCFQNRFDRDRRIRGNEHIITPRPSGEGIPARSPAFPKAVRVLLIRQLDAQGWDAVFLADGDFRNVAVRDLPDD